MDRRQFAQFSAAALTLSALPAAAQDAAAPQIAEMALGDADAPVEVIEYASFTCPHCAAFHAGPFQQLKTDYIDTGKVRFVYREVYFDRPGLWASMVARCGGPMRFFGIAEEIYDRQRDWTDGEPAEIAENLRRIGRTAGLSDADLNACLTDAATAEALVADYEANAARDGIRSTPSFLIDGELNQNMSYDDFAAKLDAALGS